MNDKQFQRLRNDVPIKLETGMLDKEALNDLMIANYYDYVRALHMTMDEFYAYKEELKIPDSALFMLTEKLSRRHYLLSDKHKLYNIDTSFHVIAKQVYKHSHQAEQQDVEDYYDVVVTASTTCGFALQRIAMHHVQKTFPWLWKKPFAKRVKKYEGIMTTDFSLGRAIADLYSDILLTKNHSMTIGDLVEIATDKKHLDDEIDVSILKVYANSIRDTWSQYTVFLTIDEDSKRDDRSLCMTLDDLFNGDIDSIASHHIWKLKDEKWSHVRQDELQIWQHPTVKKFLDNLKKMKKK